MTATPSEATSPGAAEPTPERLGLVSQALRFIAVGGFSALVDLGTYLLLLTFGVWVHGARTASFVVGTTTAYLLNRRFAFQHSEGGKARFAGFVLVYGTTFFFNIGVNALGLLWLPAEMPLRTTVAWVIGQGIGTAVNFVMLRWVVFRR